MVSVSVLKGMEYDETSNACYKVYEDTPITVPLNVCMRKRSAAHYLNVTERCNTPHGRIKTRAPALCFNQGLLGITGTVKGKDAKSGTVKLQIDKSGEESKIHNPFLAEDYLRRELVSQGKIDEKGKRNKKAAKGARQFFGDQEIERMLDFERGVVNKLTGSYLVAYDTPDSDQRQVVDVGLNMKNFTKRVHIADFVRFIAQGNSAMTILDGFNHNSHARGANHVRKHWEYSSECVQILRDYAELYPEVIEAIEASCQSRKDKAMHSL